MLDRLLEWYAWLLARGRGLFFLHGLKREEFDHLFPLAWDLANYILHSDSAAALVAHGALRDLEKEMAKQRKRIRHKNKTPRRELILNRKQMVQRLVLSVDQTEAGTLFGEISFDHDDLVLYYVKHLVGSCLANSSFYASIAINVFLYDLQLHKALSYYSLLVGEREEDAKKREHAASEKKQLIFRSLRERFGDVLRRDEQSSIEQLLVYENPAETDRAALKRHLLHLAPWDAKCSLPAGYILGQQVADLHGEVLGKTGRSAGENPQLEVNRVYALVHPGVHRELSKAMVLNPQFRIPRFFVRRASTRQ